MTSYFERKQLFIFSASPRGIPRESGLHSDQLRPYQIRALALRYQQHGLCSISTVNISSAFEFATKVCA
jgi:hypothetical protein